MSKKIFHGSCHCKRIKFQANIDLSKDAYKCNCTWCKKNSYWSVDVNIQDFKFIEGEAETTQYSTSTTKPNFMFCKHCGSMICGITINEVQSKSRVSLKLSILDDISIDEMNSIPVVYCNGRDNSYSIVSDQLEKDTM